MDWSERIRGRATVACLPSTVDNFVAGVGRGFRRRFFSIGVRLLHQSAPEILPSVARSNADFGIKYLEAWEPDLAFERLAEEPFVVAGRADHPLARRCQVGWAEWVERDGVVLTLRRRANATGERPICRKAERGGDDAPPGPRRGDAPTGPVAPIGRTWTAQ